MKLRHLKSKSEILQSGIKEIVKIWMHNKDVLKILKSHEIDLANFIKDFAIPIITYYNAVILEKAKIEDCPVDGRLMNFFASKKVSSEDFFLICINFKNAFVTFSKNMDFFNYEVAMEFDDIFKYNFFGVLQHYTAHEKVLENELNLSQILEDKYIIKSSFDIKGDILSVSQAFCEVSGFTKDELVGQKYSTLKTDDSNFDEIFKQLSSGNTWFGETKNKKKDGGYFWVENTIAPIIHDNKIIQFNSIAKDITDKKELIEQQNVLIEQSKSAAMGEMISMIAHQWRQPLQTISILSQKLSITMMTDGELKADMIDKVVDDIGMQVNYMSKTIDDFRDFFKPNKKQEQISLSDVTQKAYLFLEMMFKTDSIRFETNIKDDAIVAVYTNELVQVLINIFKNAKDAMSTQEPEQRSINVTMSSTTEFGVLEIEDSGKGIPSHLLNKIFDPYFSTKSSKNGTGLGLYMCKTIIEQHCCGKLSASNGSSGAVFKIELPLYKNV